MKKAATIFVFIVTGASAVFLISLANKGFSFSRSLAGYVTPLVIGGAAGLVAGILRSILNEKQAIIRDGFLGVIESLAAALDERDSYTHGHSRRVTVMALQIGIRLKLSAAEKQTLRLAGILHDIGKIGIPDSVLNKAGKLSDEEYAVIMKHPDKGDRILRKTGSGAIGEISGIVRHHHERYDGAGYPDRLKGDGIPFFSRIISIADSFDAMTSDRPYRKGMDTLSALGEISKGAGTQFDPGLADIFIGMMTPGTNDVCEQSPSCPVFKTMPYPEIGRAYEMQYCRSNKSACERYRLMKRGKSVPLRLLPDGGLKES